MSRSSIRPLKVVFYLSIFEKKPQKYRKSVRNTSLHGFSKRSLGHISGL